MGMQGGGAADCSRKSTSHQCGRHVGALNHLHGRHSIFAEGRERGDSARDMTTRTRTWSSIERIRHRLDSGKTMIITSRKQVNLEDLKTQVEKILANKEGRRQSLYIKSGIEG